MGRRARRKDELKNPPNNPHEVVEYEVNVYGRVLGARLNVLYLEERRNRFIKKKQ